MSALGVCAKDGLGKASRNVGKLKPVDVRGAAWRVEAPGLGSDDVRVRIAFLRSRGEVELGRYSACGIRDEVVLAKDRVFLLQLLEE